MNAPDPAAAWPDTPEAAASPTLYGSDAVAAMLRALDVPFLALNPGASFRGLHDSLVNHLGNRAPSMLLCVHEESAVAIAHGYAKVTGRPMGVVLHANVGLLHGAMGIFNAWCDRVPMLVLGATGPVDAARRRPWIDWIHTAIDQGGLVRGFTKWDDQPASVPAACEALLRAMQIARTPPCGPVYVNLDAALQEAPLQSLPALPDPVRYAPATALVPAAQDLERLAARLSQAQRPVLLLGRGAPTEAAWAARVRLAERLDAQVITDLKSAAVFPSAHRLHVGPPGHFLAPGSAAALRAADVVLALDWTDLAGTLRQACGASVGAWVANVSPDAYVHRGFSMDYQALAPADLYLMADPDVVVDALLGALPAGSRSLGDPGTDARASTTGNGVPASGAAGALTLRDLARALDHVAGDGPICLTRLPLGWHGADCRFAGPLDYLGLEGGGGVGAGPGITAGAALALRGTDRLAVGIMGDGDYLMGVTAVWTAVHYRLPCVMVVANNRSFYNDEVHQERVARARGRPVANKWIGQRMSDPDIDLAAMARAQGAAGFGPAADARALDAHLRAAFAAAARGEVAVVDVRVEPGYATHAGGGAPDRGALARSRGAPRA